MVPIMLFFIATFLAEYKHILKSSMQILCKKVRLYKLI